MCMLRSCSLLLSSALQHPALLQCLAQCTEITPCLLVLEFCPLVSIQSHETGAQRHSLNHCMKKKYTIPNLNWGFYFDDPSLI